MPLSARAASSLNIDIEKGEIPINPEARNSLAQDPQLPDRSKVELLTWSTPHSLYI